MLRSAASKENKTKLYTSQQNCWVYFTWSRVLQISWTEFGSPNPTLPHVPNARKKKEVKSKSVISSLFWCMIVAQP